jgi:hypothetical protein
MVEALAILVMAAGIALAVWWVVTDQPRTSAGLAAGALVVVAGAVLLLRGEIVRFSVDEIETIEAASARAAKEADAIRDLRASVEADAKDAADQVAANAARARRLADETSVAVAKVERRISQEQSRREAPLATVERAEHVAAAAPARASSSTQPFDVMATALRSSGSHEVTLTTSMNDVAAISLAIRLKEAIEAAGWIVHLNQTEIEPPVSGVQVLAPVPLQPHVTALLGALGRAGLQPKGLSREEPGELEVRVGSVPGKS